MSVLNSIRSKLDKMELGNDEYYYAHSLLVSRLSERDKELYRAEVKIADKLYTEKGPLNVSDEEIEAAIVAAGIED